MKGINSTLVKSLFLLILIGNTPACKHDKKGSNDLELLSILQILSGFSFPGPNPEWTRLFGQNGSGIQSNSISSDSNNNVYVTGYVTGNLDGQTKTGAYDFFLTKFDSTGSKQWTRLMGVAGDSTMSLAVNTDSFGFTHVAGQTNGALDGQSFFGTPDLFDKNLFIVRYDANGNKQWARLLGIAGGGATGATSITTDSTGNIIVAGMSESGLDGLTFSGGGSGYFIAKFNSSGTKLWTKLFAGPRPNGIACDINGKIYLTGSTIGILSLDGVAVTGTTDSFLIQFDNNGNKQWTKLVGVSGKETISKALSTDSSGNVYITGSTNGSIDDQVKSGGVSDLLTIKFDSNGNRVWARQLGFTGNIFALSGKIAEGKGISIGKNQDLYVSGSTNGNLDNQTHSDANGGKKNVFMTKYDLNGNKIWTSISGQKGYMSEAIAITTDSLGHPYATGNTDGTLNGEKLMGTGPNLFIIKY
ncbi:SBBP repeat-containing protein [Leptospira stimsonii]|uniref:Beta-propeller repeat protein n=1 Tax=Leptospira stimsonii TaxID=2202203 RepID=A0A8B3CHY9_9LEPT|nr:SBBP repeat-containing protein [Leptospira stimsonii]RHX83366.1 hypothetical protein DLM78_21960 [Leptospira stimsonii]